MKKEDAANKILGFLSVIYANENVAKLHIMDMDAKARVTGDYSELRDFAIQTYNDLGEELEKYIAVLT